MEMCISVLEQLKKGLLPVLRCDVKRMYKCHLFVVADILYHRWWWSWCMFYMNDMAYNMYFEMPIEPVKILGE